MKRKSNLLVKQLDQKIETFFSIEGIIIPDSGWIKAIRTTLNMTMAQLGTRLNITRQGVKNIEESESTGSISINSMKEVADAMELKLVYGFVPKDGTIQNLIDRKAIELARKIVERTNHNMKLEDQAIDQDKINESISELAGDLKREINKSLWD
jgi:predicted DNA-binding mobile mystery protein A